ETGRLPRLVTSIPRLMLAIAQSDVVLFWFAELPAMLGGIACRMLGRRAIVILGGFELVDSQAWGYGGRRGILRKFCTFASLRLAWKVVTVAPKEAEYLAATYPSISAETIQEGVDTRFFVLPALESRDRSVVSVFFRGSNEQV